jgi:adenylate cyclase
MSNPAKPGLEIERKFLLGAAPSKAFLAKFKKVRTAYLLQLYLRAEGGGGKARVRRVIEGSSTRYFHTVKRSLGDLVREEFEREIDKAEFDRLCLDADPERGPIRKIRISFPYIGHTMEVDIFEQPRPGLVLLEVELARPDEPLSLPLGLGIAREVSTDPAYFNATIAREAVVVQTTKDRR